MTETIGDEESAIGYATMLAVHRSIEAGRRLDLWDRFGLSSSIFEYY
jgi:hypothetical protein